MCFLQCCLSAKASSSGRNDVQIWSEPTTATTTKIRCDMLRGKKGIGYTLKAMGEPGSWVENLPRVIKLQPCWNYSWGSNSLYDLQPPMMDFLPMIYGYWGNKVELSQQVRMIKSQNPRLLLAFNEPDSNKQGNTSVDSAISAWPILESIQVPLVSPSCVHPDNTWMDEFMKQVDKNNFRVDIIGVHHYPGPNVQDFKDRMIATYKKYNERPLFLTEFGVADWEAKTPKENRYTPQQVLAFMKAILPWLEAQDWIIGYAWFPFQQDNPYGASSALYDCQGELTPCGEFYASFLTTKNPWRGRTFRMGKNSALHQKCHLSSYKSFRRIHPPL